MDPNAPPPEGQDPHRATYTAAAALSGCLLLIAIVALVVGAFGFFFFGPGPHY